MIVASSTYDWLKSVWRRRTLVYNSTETLKTENRLRVGCRERHWAAFSSVTFCEFERSVPAAAVVTGLIVVHRCVS